MSNKIAIMQPYFFPYLGYWQLINAVDTYIVYDDVTYIKGGWINRNNILLNNKAHLLTIPLEKSSSYKNINEIDIVNNIKLKNKLLKTVQYAYAKAPNFKEIMPIIEHLLLNTSNICELNYNTIIEFNKYLNINTKIILSSTINKNENLHAQDKVIDINKKLNATHYINAIGGIELYDKNTFKKNGITLNFIKMNNIKYKQFDNEFVPNLSIIDVLMFNNKNEIKRFLDEYTLV